MIVPTRISLSIAFIICCAKLFAQNIPDLKFREAISAQCGACIDANGNLKPAADSLKLLDAMNDSIMSIEGIEGFTSLTEFYCNGNFITTIQVLPDSLQTLFCSDNLIISLPATLPYQLDVFKCENNQLTSIPPLPTKLTQLFCSSNNLTSLPLLPPLLDNLTCNSNALTELPPLPESLTSLHCNSNALLRLPELPVTLQKLYCSNNSLTVLPEIPASVTSIDASANPLTCLPFLPVDIQTLNIDFTFINCLPNLPAIFQSVSPLPLCTSDSSNCTLNASVSGMAFVDYNANGVKDGIDIPMQAIKIIANQANWIGNTDSLGKYGMKIGLNNTVTIAPTLPAGSYTLVPVSRTFVVDDTSGQRFSNEDFAFQPAGDNYDLGVSLTPGLAVPSGSTLYTITYKNNSAFSIDGIIQLVFDQHLTFVSSNVNPSSQVGLTLTWNFSMLPAFTSRSINVLFSVSGGELPGNILTSSVNSTLIGHTDLVPSNNSETVTNKVVSSLQSNLMTVSDDSITPYDVAAGKYLTYILYFQNTGTTVANKIDVFDTLSSFLEANTFEMIGVSHPCQLEISNADFNPNHPVVLHWTFDNIQLLPASVDSVRSRGSINFLAKVGDNVYQNAGIRNKARLVFNNISLPVTTNTAVTFVKYPVGIANVLNDESIEVTPNPFSDFVNVISEKKFSEPSVITVYDLAGKKIQQESSGSISSQKFSIDFSNLSSGAYLMTVKTSEGISSFKIFKQ